jgi:hypothetical protein
VSSTLLVQYVGFTPKRTFREYKFQVREAQDAPREFVLSIANAAFVTHQVRYQDAPDVCSLKLQSELAANANHPAVTRYEISDADLEIYRLAHTRKTTRYPNMHKAEQEY